MVAAGREAKKTGVFGYVSDMILVSRGPIYKRVDLCSPRKAACIFKHS
jgi:hypothetical protein